MKIISIFKSVIWSRIKGFHQKFVIENELEKYTKKFKNKGHSVFSNNLNDIYLVKKELFKRLSKEEILPLTKHNKNLNIIYMSPMDSWEQVNIPDSLLPFGSVHYINLNEFEILKNEKIGSIKYSELKDAFNKNLLEQIKKRHSEKPIDFIISYFSGRFLHASTIKSINSLGIRTAAFWLDSDLKFESKFDGQQFTGAASIASAFHLNLCSDTSTLIKFFAVDALAVFWPEGANPNHFKPSLNQTKKYDVSFIGAKYGLRAEYINFLRKNGIKVNCFGFGWEGGKLNGEQMIDIYSQSKICLGFGGIGYSMQKTHLKGRDFEVPMCGSAYLTTYDEDLANLYKLDEHIFTFKNKYELLEKVKLLLANDILRENAANAARKHALSNHTWEKRFETLFEYFTEVEK